MISNIIYDTDSKSVLRFSSVKVVVYTDDMSRSSIFRTKTETTANNFTAVIACVE